MHTGMPGRRLNGNTEHKPAQRCLVLPDLCHPICAASPCGCLHHGPQAVEGVHVDQQVAQPAMQEGGGDEPPPLPRMDQCIGLQGS